MRFSWPSAITGAIIALVLPSVAVFVAAQTGAIPTEADVAPPQIEAQFAHLALHRAVAAHALSETPYAADDEMLTRGVKVYAMDCSACHGVDDRKPTTIGAGLYQTAPVFSRHGVDDDPAGETYYKVRHGIRFTGMPSFSKTLSDRDEWAVALFLKHLPHLTPHAQAAWTAMRAPVPAAADEPGTSSGKQ